MWLFKSIVSSKNCICRVIDFQIRSRCTTCSRFGRDIDTTIRVNCTVEKLHFRAIDVQIRFRRTTCSWLLVNANVYSWYVNYSEAFSFLLAWIFSGNETKLQRIYVIWLIRVLNYACLKTSWFSMHWFASLIYMLCKQTAAMKFNNILWNFLRSPYCEYTVHVLLSDNLLWNPNKVNSFQFHWTKTIFYRVICDEMLVANLWFILAYFDFVEMSCQKNAISRNFWPCLHARILWRDVVDAYFVVWFLLCSNSDEMPCLLAIDTWFVTWLSICFSTNEMPCNWSVFRFRLSALHEKYI